MKEDRVKNDGTEMKTRLENMEKEFETNIAKLAIDAGGYAQALFEELAGGFDEHFKLALVPTAQGIGYTCLPVTQHAVRLVNMLRGKGIGDGL